MRELSDLQKEMLEIWTVQAENSFRKDELPAIEERLSALINSIEYEQTISYFPRLLK